MTPFQLQKHMSVYLQMSLFTDNKKTTTAVNNIEQQYKYINKTYTYVPSRKSATTSESVTLAETTLCFKNRPLIATLNISYYLAIINNF